MSGMGVGLLIEEHRAEIHESWKRAVEQELGGERALEYAVGPLLRELSLVLRGGGQGAGSSRTDPFTRCAVLIRASAVPARVAREFKLLHRAVWDTLRRAGRIIAIEDRRSTDEWLDEALAAALERADRVRVRIDLLEAPVRAVPDRAQSARSLPPRLAQQPRQKPPPLPWNRPGSKIPPPPPIVID